MTKVLDSDGAIKQTPTFVHGMIITFYGATLPAGFALCDGNNGTPDLRDRFLVGGSSIGFGAGSGTVSPTSALTHSGAAVGAHSAHGVTQPSAHSDHVTTQAAGHSNHVTTQAADHGIHDLNATHTHDSHTTANALAGTAAVIADGFTHSAAGAHTHGIDAHVHTGGAVDAHSAHASGAVDPHSAHSGMTVDAHSAHSVTQPSSHAVLKHYLLAYAMFVG